MDFDEIIVKESPGLCRCCLSEGCYKDMGSEYSWMNETEVYADMLLECFDIGISQHTDGPNGPNRFICEVCITRLRDACNFKKQVVESEKRFVDMIGRGLFKAKLAQPVVFEMKAELEGPPVEEPEIEYLEEDIDFDDDDLKESEELTSEDITVTALPVKGKRGRPKKTVKPEKKTKIAKVEEKPRSSKAVVKGDDQTEARSKSSLTATKRNRIMKRNAIIVLESSTVVPFKWHRHNYLCFFCFQTFKDVDALKKHTSEHKKPNIKGAVSYLKRDEKVKIDITLTACRICDRKLDTFDALIRHIKTAHKKILADEYGYGVIPYRLHRDTYQCAICSENFQYFIKLNQHMNEHYGNYICELCGKSFLSQDRLRCHALSHGAGFRCNLCPETFDSLTQKNAHKSKIHNTEKTIQCFFCTQTFQNYTQRKRHHSTSHDIPLPAVNCPACDKAFEIPSKMRAHFKEVHLREKNFACSMCDQKFFSRTHVQKHMIKHMGERIHECEVCKKSYARKQTLRDHMRIHNNDKRFVCAVCSQGFVQNNSLRHHMRVHHPESNA